MNLKQKALILPFYLITVVAWAIFTFGIRAMKYFGMGDKINYWKFNGVLAVFFQDNKFVHKEKDGYSFEISTNVSESGHKTRFSVFDPRGNNLSHEVPVKNYG